MTQIAQVKIMPDGRALRTWQKERSKVWNRRKYLKRKYGITTEQYVQMVKDQNGRCAICGTDDPKGYGIFNVDHCHNTGKVRSLLCHPCNVGIGHFGDNPERLEAAASYIRSHTS